MGVEAAGIYRRTQAERDDQELSWRRSDQAFFASGACHVLAWACRDAYPARPISIAGLRSDPARPVFHTFAAWHEWTFDHSGWHRDGELLEANEQFEGRPLERVEITVDLAAFCGQQRHRMPHEFYADPVPRALSYLKRFEPPWVDTAG